MLETRIINFKGVCSCCKQEVTFVSVYAEQLCARCQYSPDREIFWAVEEFTFRVWRNDDLPLVVLPSAV